MNVAEWLFRSGRAFGARPALLDGERIVASYSEFARRAAAIAGSLRERHRVAPGDRVAILMTNRTEYLEVLYGIWWAGAVAVPINAKLHPKEAAWIIENCAARLVFVSDDVVDDLKGALTGLSSLAEVVSADNKVYAELIAADPLGSVHPANSRDLAWIFYTSGTTGRPKGVMLSHANLAAMTACYAMDVDNAEAEDANIYAAPISHGAGLYNFMPLIKGARHVVPASGKFQPEEMLALCAHLRHATMFLAPTMVRRLVEQAKSEGGNGDGIKTIIYGGAPMYLADIEEALAVMGQRFVQIYGQGETPMTITALSRALHADTGNPKYRARLASAGKAQSLVEMRVADAEGRTLPPGEIGEVLVRGPSVMSGYWQNEPATAAALRDGWLWTGDVGEMDEDGFLTMRDRSKDVIISGGSNIYPREVEEVLLTHPDVVEVAVVGRPDRDWGEEVAAFVVCKPGAAVTEAELDALCLASIARFKRPKVYFFEPGLPKSNYGKILKTELRNRFKQTDS